VVGRKQSSDLDIVWLTRGHSAPLEHSGSSPSAGTRCSWSVNVSEREDCCGNMPGLGLGFGTAVQR